MGIVRQFNVVWLPLTYRCNNRCIWCYANSDDYASVQNKILPLSEQDEILTLLHELKIPRVILIGGEPTLYPEVEKLIEKISKRRIKIGMVSNGRRFKDIAFSSCLKESGLTSVTFSIEGS